MQVKSIDKFNATCEAKGVTREVSLFLIQDQEIKPGDHVMIHVGYAIQKLSEKEAEEAWEMYDEIFRRLDEEAAD